MRALVNLRCLAILGVCLCANVSFGDLVVTAVKQGVYAEDDVAGDVVTGGTFEDYVNKHVHSSLPLLSAMAVSDPEPINASAAYGRATQTIAPNYQGPSTLNVSWLSPLSVTAQVTADAQSLNLSTPADGYSVFELTFRLVTPHAYSVVFSGALTNNLENSVYLSGPGVDKSAKEFTVIQQWSGTLQPGLYKFGLTSGSYAAGSEPAAVSTGQLSLAAVPEPSAFLLLGLVTGAAFSINWLSRVSRPDTVES